MTALQTSLRERIYASIATALAANPSLLAQSVNIYRSREVSISRDQVPAIVLMPGGARVQRMATGADKHTLDMRLQIYVRGDPWDTLADAIDTQAHAVLMTDSALWALVSDVRRVSEEVDSQEADRTAGCLTVHYQVTCMVSATDISTPPL